jgi:hypothetical protein
VNVRFLCPSCEYPGKLPLPGPASWQCPGCDHRVQVTDAGASSPLPACLVCGNHELYKKKDFPHGLGITILTVACLVSFVTYGLYQPWLTWSILIGTALFDGLLFLWVGDVVVCYRCQAHYRGLTPTVEHKPFELAVAERYRQERLRLESNRVERQP